ncbi:hypothetical protein CR513_48126, partial [Mucuna pruriens]
MKYCLLSVLRRYKSSPSIDRWKGAHKVMKYLQGTKDYMLMYKRTHASGVVSTRSVKQTLIATSTMEAKFVSCFEATFHGVWLKSFILGRVIDSIFRPLEFIVTTLVWLRTTRVEVKVSTLTSNILTIRKCVKEKKVVIKHVSTKLMIVDPLSKGMLPKNFKDHDPIMEVGLPIMEVDV